MVVSSVGTCEIQSCRQPACSAIYHSGRPHLTCFDHEREYIDRYGYVEDVMMLVCPIAGGLDAYFRNMPTLHETAGQLYV